MKRITLNIEDLFEIPEATIYNPDNIGLIRNVTIDSREIKKGSLFIAIKGKEHLVKHLIPPHFDAKVPEESCQCYLIPESVPNLPRIKKKRYQVET